MVHLGRLYILCLFRLSRQPSSLWSDIFVHTWNRPPSFTSMHRPGIASVISSKIILDGTTIEEVQRYHKKTLILCVKEANEKEARILAHQRQKEEQQRQRTERHKKVVKGIADDLDFD